MKTIVFCIIFHLLSACEGEKNIEEDGQSKKDMTKILEEKENLLNWGELPNGLWRDDLGNIGIKDYQSSEHFDKAYILTRIEHEDEEGNALWLEMKDVFDLESFENLDGTFYKDKNHVYRNYQMISGSRFWIKADMDAETFEMLGYFYAKDKKSIFAEKDGRAFRKIAVDRETFKFFGRWSKDKNGFYYQGEKVALEDFTDNEYERENIEMIKRL